MSILVGSYRAMERPGAGHRAVATGLWRGEDLRSGDAVAITLLPESAVDDARAAVAAVGAIAHPHLLPVADVVADDERVAVVCAWPAGGRLAELVLRRGRLPADETLTVLIPLAAALAAAHAGDVRHGDVSPETIWFDGRGRPLLGAIAVSRVIANLNHGLPAGCRDVAPEVVRGETVRIGPVTSAADVFSLGSVALFCLTGSSAWPADEPADVLVQSAAGIWPDPPDAAGPAPLIELVRAMLRSDPKLRPSAADVAAGLAAAGQPAPIGFGSGPAPVPASADRWRGWSTGIAPAAESDSVAAEPRVDRPAPRVDDRSAVRRSGMVRRAGIAVLLGLLVVVIAVQVGLWWTGSDSPGVTAADSGAPAAVGDDPSTVGNADWPTVIAELDAARARALAAADPALLTDVDVPASPAALADADTIGQLTAQGWRVLDGRHEIVSVTLVDSAAVDSAAVDSAAVDPAAAADQGAVRLAVVDTLPSRPIVDTTGRQVGVTPARAEQRWVLVLRPTDGGYRISEVEPG